jgi:hypothetical protein
MQSPGISSAFVKDTQKYSSVIQEGRMEPNVLVCRTEEASSSFVAPAPHLAGDTFSHHVVTTSVPAPKSRARGPLLWGMGGTILSAIGFIAMILFEQYNSLLSELRNDLKHFHETSSEYVRRDSFQKFREQFRDRFKQMESVDAARMQLEHELKTSEQAREEMTRTLQLLRERLAYVEGRQMAAPAGNPTIGPKKFRCEWHQRAQTRADRTRAPATRPPGPARDTHCRPGACR